jgi:UDP-N-acetylmuramate dehydrogenase
LEENIRSLITGSIRGEVLYDEPLSRHSSLKVGGPADMYITPADFADLQAVLIRLGETTFPWLVIGGGYNLLVRDGGYRGAVISLKHLSRLEQLDGNRLVAEAGVTNDKLVRFAAEKCLTGLEFLIGIPGTVGGALYMNAGAQGEEILDRVESLTTVRDGDVRGKERNELNYGYRFLDMAPGEIIIAATFRMTVGQAPEIEGHIEALLARRRNAQGVGYSNAGSFFKNPQGKQAWRFIEEAGLRGYRVGGAQVSEVHTNFLVNRGGARSADFIELAGIIKEKVKEQFGVILEEEVRIVGED